MSFSKKFFKFLSHLAIFLFIATLYLFDFSTLQPPDSFAQSLGEVKLYLHSVDETVSVDNTLTIPVLLDTNGQSFNAVQAEIAYPADLLGIVSIDTASSVFKQDLVNFGAEGKISLVRGSFTPVTGNSLLIANVTFKALKPGNATLTFLDESAVVNSNIDSLTAAPGLQFVIQASSPTPSATPSATATPTPTAIPTPTPSPTPPIVTGSRLAIYAAGTSANGVYPTLKLQIQNPKTKKWEVKKTFTNVRGNPAGRVFVEYIYTHPTKLNLEQIRLVFTNDKYLPKRDQDRNLVVDKIILDGVDYHTENSTTFSTGTWSSDTGCKNGYKSSEWLHCNGYFQFK